MDIKDIGSIDFGTLSTGEARELGINVMFEEPDGTYDWIYSLQMLKNLSMFKFLVKVIILCFIPLIIIPFLASGGDLKEIITVLGIFAIIFAAIVLIVLFAIWLIDKLYKGNYILVYQMNDEQLIFSQTTDQAQITRIIAATSAAVSAVGNNPGGVISGTGMALSPNGYLAKFAKVRSVKGVRKDNMIWVNTFLQYLMVYVSDEYYDFVWNYITQRCVNARIIEK